MKPVEVSMAPALFTSLDGTRYAIAGSAWVEVPAGTTFDELPLYMVHKQREFTPAVGEKVWNVEGSKGNIYSVSLADGAYTCSCPGFGYRRKCRHITEIKNESS